MTAGTAAKAVLAGVTAAVGCLATAATDGSISLAEWLTSASAALVALGAVYGVPNTSRGVGNDAGQ